MQENKNHWYDGKFYDKLIAPNLDVTFIQMMRMIEPESKVIDIGCATGRFVFKLSERVSKAVGVDLSQRNIKLANRIKQQKSTDNVYFVHANALKLSEVFDEKFDYATISYVLHEMDYSIRVDVLKEMKTIANQIIIADYFIPQPKNLRGLLNRTAELLAGKDHFSNYITFKNNGGLNPLLDDAGLSVIEKKSDSTLTSYIVKVK